MDQSRFKNQTNEHKKTDKSSAVFYHHSKALFEEFDMERCNSSNGSGLWANLALNPSLSQQSSVEYSFTAKDAKFIRVGKPLDEADFNQLLAAAKANNDDDLVSIMEKHGVEEFVPYQHAGGDYFTIKHRDAITQAGFDGIITGDNTACFLKVDKVSEFHLLDAKGSFETEIEEMLAKNRASYAEPEGHLIEGAGNDVKNINYLNVFDTVSKILEAFSEEKPDKLNREKLHDIKSDFGRLLVMELEGKGHPNFSGMRMLLYLVDKKIPSAQFEQGASFDVFNPYSPTYLQPIAAKDGSFGKLKEDLREALKKPLADMKRTPQVQSTPLPLNGAKKMSPKL